MVSSSLLSWALATAAPGSLRNSSFGVAAVITPRRILVRWVYHASVTACPHYEWMSEAPDGSPPRKAGALVLRVWLEGTADDPRLRIRLVGRQDVTRDVRDIAAASTIDDALDHVRMWLDRFRASAGR
jgi:hypothetical protein